MKKVIVGIALLAVLGLALLVLRKSPAESPSPVRKRLLPERRVYLTEEIASSPLELTSNPGDRRRYRVRYRYEVSVDVGFSPTAMVFEVEGDLTVRVYERSLQGLQFRPLLVTSLGPNGEPVGDFGEMRATLEQEILVTLDEEGRTRSLRFPPDTNTEGRNILRGLLSALEVVVPVPCGERWVVRGEDTLGRYLARYSIASRTAEETRLSRSKTYEEIFMAGLPATEKRPFDVQNDGETQIRIDSKGRVALLEGRESIQLLGCASELAVQIRSASTVHLVLLESNSDDPDVRQGLSRARKRGTDSTGYDGFAPEGTRLNRTSVRAGAVAEILEGLSQITEAAQWAHQAPHAYLSLKEIFSESEEARAMAQNLLREGRQAPEVLQTLADALGATPSGWKALLPLASEGSLVAVQALGLTPHPPEEVIRTLAECARRPAGDPLAETAIDAFGLAAGLPGNLLHRDALAEELTCLLGQGKDARVLHALGNAGSPKSLEVVLAQSGSSDPEIRAGVAKALRKQTAPEAVQALVSLSADPVVSVRESAVSMLVRRSEPSVRAVLEKAARDDSEESVRLEALGYFAQRGDREVLLQAASNDPSESVRNFAKAALNR